MSDEKKVIYGGPVYWINGAKPNNDDNCEYSFHEEPSCNCKTFYYVCNEGHDPCVIPGNSVGLLPNLLGILGFIITIVSMIL